MANEMSLRDEHSSSRPASPIGSPRARSADLIMIDVRGEAPTDRRAGPSPSAVAQPLSAKSRSACLGMAKHPACLSLSILILGIVCTTQVVSAAGGQNQRSEKPTTTFDQTQFPKYRPDRVLVRFRPGVDRSRMQAFHAKLGDKVVSEPASVDRLQIVQLTTGTKVKDAIKSYRSNPDVLYAEPDYLMHALETPNDPLFPLQWSLRNTGQNGGTPGADIHATQAWNLSEGNSSVVVAVLDTGVDYRHPDLAAQVWTASTPFGVTNPEGNLVDCPAGSRGIDLVYNDCEPLDDNGHGTAVSGVIGAQGNNGIGVAGINWNVTILPCKFLSEYGAGYASDAIVCLDLVKSLKDSGVNIVATNNSYGGFDYSQALQDAIAAQMQDGILFIAAAGNDFASNDASPTYPANVNLPNVISVAATDENDRLAGFSNFGRRTVDLGAPGVDILSATPDDTYSYLSGTSLSSPEVAGVAALLKAQNPTLDWRAIKNLILAGGDAIPSLSDTITQRRLDAYGAMTCSNSTVETRLQPVLDTISASVGTPITLSMLHINCVAPAGGMSVQISGGGPEVTLVDDGTGADLAAGDGIYTGQWTPTAPGSYTLSYPDGSVVNVEVLTAYGVTKVAHTYQTITGANLNLGDDSVASITSPFPIPFGGGSFTQLYVGANGTISFTDDYSDFVNQELVTNGFPSYDFEPNTLVAPFWMDLYPVEGTDQNVFWQVIGSAPNRQLVVEWRNVRSFECPDDANANVTFEVVFQEGSSNVQFNYGDVVFGGDCDSEDDGLNATIGILSSPSLTAEWSYDAPSADANTSLLWRSPPVAVPSSGVPTLTSIVPSAATIYGPSLTITINGTGFTTSSVAYALGPLATTYISSTQLTAILPQFYFDPNSLYAVYGGGTNAAVYVQNPSPGGGTSNSIGMTLLNPVPAITSVSPNIAVAGGAQFQITVTGNDLADAGIRWNGQTIPCTPLDNSHEVATVSTGLIASAGTAQIQAFAPTPGGGLSNTLSFTIEAAGSAPSGNSSPTPTATPAPSLFQANTATAPPPVHPLRFMGWKQAAKIGQAYVQKFSRPYIGSGNRSALATNPAVSRGSSQGITADTPPSLTQPSSLPGFAFHPTLPAGYIPTATATGDFNRDGKMDWVEANGGGNDLWIYFGNGDGTFQIPKVIALAGQSPMAVTAVSLRKNGILDLVVAEADSNTVGVLLGNGDGTFAPEIEYPVSGPALSVAAADFNGDGNVDLAVGLEEFNYPGPIAMLPGDGTGKFGTPIPSPVDFNTPTDFATTTLIPVDLNGDGRPDLVVVDQGGANPGVFSYINEGNGVFKQAQAVFEDYVLFFLSAAVGDMNEDGCPDIVAADVNAGVVETFLGNCDGTFQAGTPMTGGGSNFVSIALADLNGDGHLDVVAGGDYFGEVGYGQVSGNLISVLLGDGKGDLGEAHVVRSDPSMYALALADFNGDGHPDIVAASQDVDTASVFLNDGQGNFAGPAGEYIGYPPPVVSNAPLNDFFVLDVNGDGKPDLAAFENPGLASEWEIAVMLNDGTGKFGPPIQSQVTSMRGSNGYDVYDITDAALADFRNTGHPDVLTLSYDVIAESNPTLSFAPYIGNGAYGLPQTMALTTGEYGSMAVGDFDGDGKLDVAIAGLPNSSTGPALTIYHGNGDGTFTPGFSVNYGTLPGVGDDGVDYMKAIDCDGDGKLDLLYSTNGGDLYEMLGNGDGTFGPARDVMAHFGGSTIADLNHDGLPDIVQVSAIAATSTSPGAGVYSVYLGQKDGSFKLSQTYQVAGGLPYLDTSDPKAPFHAADGPILADFNSDGNLDIGAVLSTAVFNSSTETFSTFVSLQVLTGNGDGTFNPTGAVFPFNKGSSPQEAVDLNGDGRADLIEMDGFTASFNVIPGAPGPAVQLAISPTGPFVGSQGTLQVFLSVASGTATTVQLSASDPNIAIASSVTIPAGQLTASVPFTIGPNFVPPGVFGLTAQVASQSATLYSYQTSGALAGFVIGSDGSNQLTVSPGQTANVYGVNVSSYGGYSSTLQLSCLGLPAGSACNFNDNPLPLTAGDSGVELLHVTTSPNTPIGIYPFTVQATDGILTQQLELTLNVADFTISVTPSTASIFAGNSATFNVTIGAIGYWHDPVDLNCSSTPPGLSFCDFQGSGPPNGLPGPGILTVTTYTTSPGDYVLTVTGQPDLDGNYETVGASHNAAPITVHVGSASGSVSPTSQTIAVGSSMNFNVTLTSVGSLTGQFTFACPNVPSGLACSFVPPSGTLPADGTLPSVLTVTVNTQPASLTPRPRGKFGGPDRLYELLGALWLLALAILFWQLRLAPARFKRVYGTALTLVLLVSLAALVACGGGGGSSGGSSGGSPPPTEPTQPTPQPTTVQVSVQATSTIGNVSVGTLTITVP
jgi:subtilisin family serine protease